MPTEGSPISLGSLDLRDFCGCPPEDCPECCEPICGCDALPDTIFATFSNGGSCPCASGSVPLVFDGVGAWESGSVTIGSCGANGSIRFYCGGSEAAPTDFRIDTDGCFTTLTGVTPTGGTCDPFSINFSVLAVLCCGGVGTIDIEVTL